jgi:hypothetical protein
VLKAPFELWILFQFWVVGADRDQVGEGRSLFVHEYQRCDFLGDIVVKYPGEFGPYRCGAEVAVGLRLLFHLGSEVLDLLNVDVAESWKWERREKHEGRHRLGRS